jgi:hypothetical protein
LGKFHRKSAVAKIPSEVLAKQRFDVRFIINHKNKKLHADPP